MKEHVGISLDTETDALNARLQAAEKALIAMRLGVFGSIPLPMIDRFLVFQKRGSAWGLFVLGPDNDAPILTTSRELRVQAAVELPKMVEVLMQNATTQLDAVRRANGLLDEMLAAFNAPSLVRGGGEKP